MGIKVLHVFFSQQDLRDVCWQMIGHSLRCQPSWNRAKKKKKRKILEIIVLTSQRTISRCNIFLGVAFESSLLFGIYSQIKQPLEGGLQSSKPQPSVIIPSAAISGGIISFVLCPSEPVKCRMQVLGTESLVPKSSRYNGPLDCALKTVKTEGESIGNTVFFSTYESVHYYMHLQLKDASSNQNNLTDVGVGIMSGGLSGITIKDFPRDSTISCELKALSASDSEMDLIYARDQAQS
ncbi:hypothetical protein HYC85_022111 [Camellia sinensis]|uniref:Uncharacterized protein n=1 Tax=Camellia sinensis TaxID=4442 RepID=A0A7J7GND4_CAMSI|nr:hypothetical protein HYC85_022111 [Camellia sinensis]